MSGKVSKEWFAGDSATFLLEQIAIVQPRVVVALGEQAYRAIMLAFDMPISKGPFRRVVEAKKGVPLDGAPEGVQLFGVYHCGAQVRNTIRPMAQQYEDWRRIGLALGSD
jgi:uracil-DNA glycosylase